jgi:glycosyltransferase involved in cell wall biosynthesis
MDGVGAVSRRGRVVMLVDNGVRGDSRVQKAAWSAAAAGWDVTLIGSLGRATEDRWRIGDAEVRLVPVINRLGHGLYGRPKRRSPRYPFAFPLGPVAGARQQAIKAWKTDVQTRRAAVAVERQAGREPGLLSRAGLSAAWFMARAAGRWVRFRSDRSSRLKASQDKDYGATNGLRLRFWDVVRRERAWRRLDPGLWAYELAFGPVIDELKPDIIHAHDFRMVGVGARAMLRARAAGRQVKFIYDAHELVPGIVGRIDPRWLPAQVAYEREFIRYADAVITVSPVLADMLQESHGLRERPAVVMNAPPRAWLEDAEDETVPDLRALCGIDGSTPLLAYCGGINPSRGLDTMIDALPKLPDVHIALVVIHPSGRSQHEELTRRAEALGVADRVHLLQYVPLSQVSEFLAAADAGVIPNLHQPNNEIALNTKFFEFSHARLPLVVSDVRTISGTVTATGQGVVYRAGDVDDYVRAVREILADPQRYRAAYDTPGLLEGWTWEAQAEIMDEVYERLMPSGAAARSLPGPTG